MSTTNTTTNSNAMTAEQIAAISDPVLRAAVEALLKDRNTLAAKVKEKSPSWIELGIYGKGKVGVQVSKKGQVQFTGTRKAYGGLFLFVSELRAILTAAGVDLAEDDSLLTNWLRQHDAELQIKAISTATVSAPVTNGGEPGDGVEKDENPISPA